MIGSMIDRAALTVLGAAGLYLFFLNAGFAIAISAALAFVCMCLLRRLSRRFPGRNRVSRTRAEAALLVIAERGDADALRKLAGDDRAMTVIRHPDGTFTLNDLFELWQEEGDGIAVAVTCASDEAARHFAKAHGIALADRDVLLKRIRRTGWYVPEEAPRPSLAAGFSRVGERLMARPLRPRALLCAFGLIVAYITTGQTLCLACGLGLMGLTGIKLIDRYVS